MAFAIRKAKSHDSKPAGKLQSFMLIVNRNDRNKINKINEMVTYKMESKEGKCH